MEDVMNTKIDEDKEIDIEQPTTPIDPPAPVEEEKALKFVAFIKEETGDINFNIGGLEMDEAYLLVLKGKSKFQKLYDKWLDEQA